MRIKNIHTHLLVLRSIILFSLVSSICSCSQDEEENDNVAGGGGNNTPEYFMNVSINGQPYETNSVSIFGFSNQEGCLPIDYHLSNIGQISIADYFFDAYLFHYENNEDFTNVDPGNGGSLGAAEYFSTPEGDNCCNFHFVVGLQDEQQADDATTLTSATHNVTSITQVGQNSTDITYAIEGAFTCSFLNVIGEQINITGTYRIPIDCSL